MQERELLMVHLGSLQPLWWEECQENNMKSFAGEKRLLLCMATFIVATTNIGVADTLPNIIARAFLNEDTGDVKIKAEQGDLAVLRLAFGS